MQNPIGAAQTEQWSLILQTVWGWIWGGLSWIVDWQVQVFRVAATGTTFWEAFGKALLLFFPAMVLVTQFVPVCTSLRMVWLSPSAT